MKQVCCDCHTPDYVNLFYKQYDDFVVHYNEKFAKPGQTIMERARLERLITKTRVRRARSSGPGSTSGTTRAGARGRAPR